jgi:hypothetical protein
MHIKENIYIFFYNCINMFSNVLLVFGLSVLMTMLSPTIAFSSGDGNGDHGKGSDVDIHVNVDFSSGEDKSCADNYVTVFTIENSERTYTDFCDTEEENGELSFDFQLGSIEKGQVINACAFDGDILEEDGDEFGGVCDSKKYRGQDEVKFELEWK